MKYTCFLLMTCLAVLIVVGESAHDDLDEAFGDVDEPLSWGRQFRRGFTGPPPPSWSHDGATLKEISFSGRQFRRGFIGPPPPAPSWSHDGATLKEISFSGHSNDHRNTSSCETSSMSTPAVPVSKGTYLMQFSDQILSSSLTL